MLKILVFIYVDKYGFINIRGLQFLLLYGKMAVLRIRKVVDIDPNNRTCC